MKMVKSLLLASAAGLAAASGAQAADLPVKAVPVEYVKVCSLYGEGFFYIPGTDTCLKIGGWVRVEAMVGAGGSHAIFTSGGTARNDRIDNSDGVVERARTVLSLDARTQTEYGTLRSYARFGFDHTTTQIGTGLLYVERAFIQFAGFTAGKTQSFFDFFAGVFNYGQNYTGGASSGTGGGGVLLYAYTAQFGNGFSATISAEQNTDRRNAVWDATDAVDALTIGNMPGPSFSGAAAVTGFCGQGNLQSGCFTGDYAAPQFPDLVANLRVDQAWGSAQIAGALHQVRAGYYGINTNFNATAAGGGVGQSPPDQWGWAAMAGVVFNIPWNTGDKFWIEGAYARGAPSYVGLASNGLYSFWNRFNGRNVAAAWALDGVFCGSTSVNTAPCQTLNGGLGVTSGLILSESWSIGAAIEHYWTPALRTSLWGNYSAWSPTDSGNEIMCASPSSPVRRANPSRGVGANPAANGRLALDGCDFSFAHFGAGIRTIWNPVRNLDIGLEVMYTKVETNHDPGLVVLNFAGAGGRPAGLYAPSSEEAWSGIVRLQRNFWP